MIERPENIDRRGKDHCMIGFQVNKIGFDHKRQYVFICM